MLLSARWMPQLLVLAHGVSLGVVRTSALRQQHLHCTSMGA